MTGDNHNAPRGAFNTWAGVDTNLRLDSRWLATPDDRVRLASVLRLLIAKQTGRPSWPAAAWQQLLGEYGDTLDALVAADFLESGPDGEIALPVEEWNRLNDLRSDPTAADRQRRQRQRRREQPTNPSDGSASRGGSF